MQYRADARRAILDAAEEILVEGGLEGFSMRRLAERCGFTAPTIYHYFRDKTGLVDELLEERLRTLVAELRAVELSGGPLGNLRSLAMAFARFGLRNPSHYQLLVMKRAPDTPEPPSGEEARALVGVPLDDLVQRGVLDAEDREALRQGLWSLIHGTLLLQATRPDEDWVPDLLERSIDALVHGFVDRERRGERS